VKIPLSPVEAAALERAREQFLYWTTNSDGPRKPVNPKLIARIRKAARDLHNALHPLMSGPNEQPTLVRLAIRMQETERLTAPAPTYSDELMHLYWRAGVIDRACGAEVSPRRKKDPRVTEWICRAASEWQAAGGTPSARHRFGGALLAYRGKGIPLVSSASVIERALVEWKAARPAIDGG
jgi:hypothetical protein